MRLSDSLSSLSDFSRFFVPGHKGVIYQDDVTELDCTDDLYRSNGTIRDIECAISRLYGSSYSCLSTCGNTLCIQSMLSMCRFSGEKIVVPRNVHKSSVYSMGLLNIDPIWVDVEKDKNVKVDDIKNALCENTDVRGVFVTSPDYFGRIADISSIKSVCVDVPLLVDNAHGSHLIFFNMHPIGFGADFCADSAHKTLPVLTGGAWFHVGKNYAKRNRCKFEDLKYSAEIFSTTSPSFLTLKSIEKCAYWMENEGKKEFEILKKKVSSLKKKFGELFDKNVDDPIRICFDTQNIGYSCEEFISHLSKFKIKPEFGVGFKTVLIPSPFNEKIDWERLDSFINSLSPKDRIYSEESVDIKHEKKMSIHDAIFSNHERVEIEKCVGKISAQVVFNCPPGVAEIVPGEVISRNDINKMKLMGLKSIMTVRL